MRFKISDREGSMGSPREFPFQSSTYLIGVGKELANISVSKIEVPASDGEGFFVLFGSFNATEGDRIFNLQNTKIS